MNELSKEVKHTIESYFNSINDQERKYYWTKLIIFFQLHMHNPRNIKFRIIKSRDNEHPILIFKNHETQSKLLIPLIPDRIIKLNLGDFVNTGIVVDILSDLTYDSRMYKVYNDLSINKKPVAIEGKAV